MENLRERRKGVTWKTLFFYVIKFCLTSKSTELLLFEKHAFPLPHPEEVVTDERIS
jgi:hypothetical protein